MANPGVSTTLGWPVGFWAAELFHPYLDFTQRRYEVTIASPEGGKVEVEEDFGDAAVGQPIMPFRIEDEARRRGANFIQGGRFKAFAVRDMQLITGQQQYSGRKVAKLVIQALGD